MSHLPSKISYHNSQTPKKLANKPLQVKMYNTSKTTSSPKKCGNQVHDKSRENYSHFQCSTHEARSKTDPSSLLISQLNSKSHRQKLPTFSNSYIQCNPFIVTPKSQIYQTYQENLAEDQERTACSSQCEPELKVRLQNSERENYIKIYIRDQATMTRNISNVGCCQPTSVFSSSTCEAAVMASDYVPSIRRRCLVESRPILIERSVIQHEQWPASRRQNSNNSHYSLGYKVINSASTLMTKRCAILNPEKRSRTIIYNEGIMDADLRQEPSRFMKLGNSKCYNKNECIRRHLNYSNSSIPYSYKFSSRYHDMCKEHSNIHCNRMNIMEPKPRRSGMLKRLLTSESDIESFLHYNNAYEI